MRRHKIVIQIILLILSVINFALAAPVSIRGIAEDATTASRKRWNPSDKRWTNAGDRTNTPSSLGSSDSDYRLEQELRPHDPRSPIDLNTSPHSSLGSRDSDNSHPFPVGSPPPVDSNATPQPSLSVNSHPLPVGSPPLAHNNLPLDIDLNAAPQPSLSVNSHPFPVNPPPPAHNNLPLDIDLNASPQPSQELTDGSDSGSHSTSSESSSDVTMSPSSWYEKSVFGFPKPPSGSPPHGSSDIDLNRPLSPGPTDDQPPPSPPPDPGSSKRPYLLSDDSDPGPSKRPYRPSDPGPSTPHPPSNPSQEPTNGADSGSHSTGSSMHDYDSASTSIYNSDLTLPSVHNYDSTSKSIHDYDSASTSIYNSDLALPSIHDYDSASTSIYNSDLMGLLNSYHPMDVSISPSAWYEMSVYEISEVSRLVAVTRLQSAAPTR
jgi:hypothetical protein